MQELLREGEPGRSDDAQPSRDQGLLAQKDRPLSCRSCGNPVANARDVFPADSPGIYANPHGRVFEILTVSAAWGLTLWGEPTLEHTWFAGYAWRVAFCSRCARHLGWSYEAARPGLDPGRFFGLLRAELAENPE